jgi:hypothetical protein
MMARAGHAMGFAKAAPIFIDCGANVTQVFAACSSPDEKQ